MSFTETLTGGIVGGSPNYAALAKRSEARRKGIIDLGLQQIGAVFEGGQAPFYTLANYGDARFDPKSTYFFQNKKGQFAPYWAPGGARPSGQFNSSGFGKFMSGGGYAMSTGDPGFGFVAKGLGLDRLFGDEDSPREIAAKKFRRGQLFNAPETKSFEGFSPEFFQRRAQAYIDYAMPQVAEQYRQAREAQTFGLANRGLLRSTQAQQARSQLERTSGQARQGVADTALAQANETRRQIEASRQQAIDQLYQTADPARAFQSALSSASQFRAPSSFAPIVNTFASLANQYYLNKVLSGSQASQGTAESDRDIGYYLAPLT